MNDDHSHLFDGTSLMVPKVFPPTQHKADEYASMQLTDAEVEKIKDTTGDRKTPV